MSGKVILGCDRNNPSDDRKTQEFVAGKLKSAGFEVEIIPVGPNYCQQWGKKSSSKGTTCVMLINGVGQVTAGDFSETIASGFYKYDRIIFAGQGWLWHTQTCDVFKKVTNEHDWNGSASFKAKYAGKTFDQVCKESNGRCDWCCDKTKEGLAKKIIAKLNGKSTDDGDGGGSASTIKDALKQLLSYWDGEVECRLEGNKVYVNKIPLPTDELQIIEGINIVADSLTIHDYYPDTVNLLTVHWQGGEDIVYRDEKLIARFGEKPSEMDAVKKVTTTETKEEEKTTTNDDGEEETTTETKTETKTEEVPITTLEEAQAFAEREWNKIRRKNGHTIECKVIPSPLWKQGKWVKVEIPSMNEDCYMYITKVSNSDSGDGEWSTNLSLVDYPPGFGEYQEETTDDENEEEDESTEETE